MLPLAILAVRGFGRLRAGVSLPAYATTALAIAALVAGILPALTQHARGVRDQLSSTTAGALAQQQFRLTADQAAALSYLDRAPRAGGVLAPWLVSISIPGLTGRAVYAGHPQWQPHGNVPTDGVFFDPATHDPTGAVRRAILRRSKAVFVLAGCDSLSALSRDLAPLARPVKRFGCMTVYELR
jgi:hypothetical protein